MTSLESAAVAFCQEVKKLGPDADVSFYYDNGMTSAFQVVKVPTLRIIAFGVNTTCDHEGVRAPR